MHFRHIRQSMIFNRHIVITRFSLNSLEFLSIISFADKLLDLLQVSVDELLLNPNSLAITEASFPNKSSISSCFIYWNYYKIHMNIM